MSQQKNLTLFQLSPFLTLRVSQSDEEAIYENYLINEDLAIHGIGIIKLFDVVREPQTREQILERIKAILEVVEEEANELFNEFLNNKVFVNSNDIDIHLYSKMKEVWLAYNWRSAFYLHTSLRDDPFLNYDTPLGREPDNELMRQYMQVDNIPDKYKLYPSENIIAFTDSSDLPEVTLLDLLRKEQTNLPQSEITIKLLGDLLFYVVGQIGIRPWPEQGDFIRRTSPSGGARHPTECYVVCGQVSDLSQGLYHYNVRNHGLDTIQECSISDEIITELAPSLGSLPAKPSVVLLFTSMVERSMWRYRHSRSYRVILMDIGHILTTLRLVATAFNLEVVIDYNVNVNNTESMLNLNPFYESCMVAVGIYGGK